jgi:hypothetical protein
MLFANIKAKDQRERKECGDVRLSIEHHDAERVGTVGTIAPPCPTRLSQPATHNPTLENAPWSSPYYKGGSLFLRCPGRIQGSGAGNIMSSNLANASLVLVMNTKCA